MVVCDSYGAMELLMRLLPVVCRRKSRTMFEQLKVHCMEAAAKEAVLVFARISRRMQSDKPCGAGVVQDDG